LNMGGIRHRTPPAYENLLPPAPLEASRRPSLHRLIPARAIQASSAKRYQPRDPKAEKRAAVLCPRRQTFVGMHTQGSHMPLSAATPVRRPVDARPTGECSARTLGLSLRPGRAALVSLATSLGPLLFGELEPFQPKLPMMVRDIWRGGQLRWRRLSEQFFRVDKWSVCRG
jgi:hypothetical protein